MSETELRYDDRVEQMMRAINDASSVYLTEGVKANPPAIGALRFHRTDNDEIRTSGAITATKTHLPDGLGIESEKLGEHTVEVRVYSNER
jgi:hypothetical protein